MGKLCSVVVLVSVLFSGLTFGAAGKKPITDPYAFVQTLEKSKSKQMVRIFLDLDGQAKPEILIGVTSHNKAGVQTFHVMGHHAQQATYRYLGKVQLNPKATEAKQSRHGGYSDLVTFEMGRQDTGDLVEFRFNGREYVEYKRSPLLPEQVSTRLVPQKLHLERSSKNQFSAQSF